MLALILTLLTTPGPNERAGRPPGIPNYTHPYGADERAAAVERVWEVYDAIDEATDNPEWRAELRRVCLRESRCNWTAVVGLHGRQSKGAGRDRWSRAVARGLLHPEACEAHRLGAIPSLWAVNGAFGIATAYVLRHTGECTSPETMHDPQVSARAAVGHMEVLCRRHRACSCEARTRWWVGPGIWARRPALRNLRSLSSQCGPVPWWEYIGAAWEDYWPAVVGVAFGYPAASALEIAVEPFEHDRG